MTGEPFACPLCGGESFIHELTLHDLMYRTINEPFQIVRCTGCGLLRLHPLPDEQTLASAYPSSYSPYARPGLSGRAKSWLERRSVSRLWPYLRPPRRVLDVGCAAGEFLAAVRDAGNPDVFGVEPGEVAARAARSRELDVFHGMLEDAGFPSGSFQTVVASHTLEHVVQPVRFLREIHRILSTGGALLLWLPNVESVEARTLGRYWIGYDAPRHLTTFGVSTLTRALDETGFRVVDVHHERTALEWAWALRLYLRERWPASDRLLRRLHALLIVLATPLSLRSASRRQSGRIRVVAIKRPAPASDGQEDEV